MGLILLSAVLLLGLIGYPEWLLLSVAGLIAGLVLRRAAAMSAQDARRWLNGAVGAFRQAARTMFLPTNWIEAGNIISGLRHALRQPYSAADSTADGRLHRRVRLIRIVVGLWAVAIVVMHAVLILKFDPGTAQQQQQRILDVPAHCSTEITYLENTSSWSVVRSVRAEVKPKITPRIGARIVVPPRIPAETNLDLIGRTMSDGGWRFAGADEARALFIREHEQPAMIRWIPLSTVNTIPLSIGGSSNVFCEAHDLQLLVPKGLVAATYPNYSARIDVLQENLERLIINPDLSRKAPLIRVELISPLARSRIGQWLSTITYLDSLKYFIVLLTATFSEEIKKKWLLPIVRWILDRNHGSLRPS